MTVAAPGDLDVPVAYPSGDLPVFGSGLARDELAVAEAMARQLAARRANNLMKAAYYQGEYHTQHWGISVPRGYERLAVVVGWPGTAVDVIEERLDWLGWTGADHGLADVYRDNRLASESSMAHLDALVYGTSFVSVGRGGDGEPDVLVTAESPLFTTGVWDARKRRLTAALSFAPDGLKAALRLPDATVSLARSNPYDPWEVAERDDHRLGRVSVVRLSNRPRAQALGGRSEITRSVRTYTDEAVRTILCMAVNREFFSSPQRWLIGVSEADFTGPDGAPLDAWRAVMGRILALPTQDDGTTPSIGQFPQASPLPYLDQLSGLIRLLSAETAIPPMYLGASMDQLPSADSMRALSTRMLRHVERRQGDFTPAWAEAALLATLVRDGDAPAGLLADVSAHNWRDARTENPAADVDQAVKLAQAGLVPADSPVLLKRAGFANDEIEQIEADRRAANARASFGALLERARSRTASSPEAAQTGGENADAAR